MENILAIALAVAIAIERAVEVVKPLYLKTKNFILKKAYAECTKTEKIIMSVLAGPAICYSLGLTANIPYIPDVAQPIALGIFASVGSNIIHTIISALTALKDATEGLKK